jgi:hypothetical protein
MLQTFLSSLTLGQDKIECLSLASFFPASLTSASQVKSLSLECGVALPRKYEAIPEKNLFGKKHFSLFPPQQH